MIEFAVGSELTDPAVLIICKHISKMIDYDEVICYTEFTQSSRRRI